MKGKLVGWLLSAAFIVVVVAVAMRTPVVKNWLTAAPKAA